MQMQTNPLSVDEWIASDRLLALFVFIRVIRGQFPKEARPQQPQHLESFHTVNKSLVPFRVFVGIRLQGAVQELDSLSLR